VSTNVLGSCYEASVLAGRKNRSARIFKMLSLMNAQTAILRVINGFGVVVPIPKAKGTESPNFVELMNPSSRWCGSSEEESSEGC
jgi:hypothetical protein